MKIPLSIAKGHFSRELQNRDGNLADRDDLYYTLLAGGFFFSMQTVLSSVMLVTNLQAIPPALAGEFVRRNSPWVSLPALSSDRDQNRTCRASWPRSRCALPSSLSSARVQRPCFFGGVAAQSDPAGNAGVGHGKDAR